MRYPHFWFANNVHLFALIILASHMMFDSLWYGIFWLFLFWKLPKRLVLIGTILVYGLHLIQSTPPLPETCMVIRVDDGNSICKSSATIELEGIFQVGDVIELHGFTKEIISKEGLFRFDYARYLKAKGIDYLYVPNESIVLSHKTTIYQIREWAKAVIEDYPEKTKSYLYALVLGDRSLFEEELYQKVTDLGISHLFAISGLHVGFIVLLLEKMLPDTSFKRWFIRLFLLFFLIVAGWSVSILRAVGLFFVLHEAKRFGYTALDSLSFVFLCFYLWNPYVLYDIAFQLSFGVTFALLIGNDFIKGGMFAQLFWVSLVANVATVPILIQLNHAVQPFSIILNVFFVWVVSTVLFPLVFFSFFLTELTMITEALLPLFESLLDLDISAFLIAVPHMHPLMILLYYASFLNERKYLWSVVLVFQVLIGGEWAKEDLILFDVGQGNAMFEQTDCTLLFDTGTQLETERTILPYLEALNVKELDYLMISHGDFDHAGGVELLFQELEIHHFVVSKIRTNDKVEALVQKAKKLGIDVLEVSVGDVVCHMEVLEPSATGSSNDESIVLRLKAKSDVLFLADSELKKSYGEIDILELGHHGSRTSTSAYMMDEMNPELVLISVGAKNPYGLPNPDVLDLVNVPIYRTDQDGSLYYDFEDEWIRTSVEVLDEIYHPIWYTTR